MPPFTSMGLSWSVSKASSSTLSTSLTIYHGPHTQTQLWRGHSNTSSPSGGWKYLAWALRSSKGCTNESILNGAASALVMASDLKELQRVVHMAQYITGAELPPIQDLYTRQCQRKALQIVKDFSHPSHRLFSLLSHSKRYWCRKSGANRNLNSFYPRAIRWQNNLSG